MLTVTDTRQIVKKEISHQRDAFFQAQSAPKPVFALGFAPDPLLDGKPGIPIMHNVGFSPSRRCSTTSASSSRNLRYLASYTAGPSVPTFVYNPKKIPRRIAVMSSFQLTTPRLWTKPPIGHTSCSYRLAGLEGRQHAPAEVVGCIVRATSVWRTVQPASFPWGMLCRAYKCERLYACMMYRCSHIGCPGCVMIA